MNIDRAVDRLAAQAGILPAYRDMSGLRRLTSRETKLALLRACGWQVDNDAMVLEDLRLEKARRKERLLPEEIVLQSGQPFRLAVPESAEWRLDMEGVQESDCAGRADSAIDLRPMPAGIHKLTVNVGRNRETVRVIAAPKSAPSVAGVAGRERLWGVNLALYGLHSERNPGVGDYEDLARASVSFADHGASFAGLNPIHAIGWASQEVISPYSPSHRGFLNTAHIAVDRIQPVSVKTQAMIARWRRETEMTSGEFVDYKQHASHHRPILRALYDDFRALASRQHKTMFAQYCEREGSALRQFAEFERLSEQHGTDWRRWPDGLRQPTTSQATDEGDTSFHMWLQWQAEAQLQAAQSQARSAGMGLGLYLDLAVGSRRDGAEAWTEQSSIAKGVSIGAPPDHLSPAGQNWNLTAFAPQKLASGNYEALRSILARTMRHCGLLRIDHVLGLNRSFWIPDDGTPGGYIRQNYQTLLAILRIEAERCQTVIVGEDLGLVPEGFRKALRESGIYSYSVLQYEKTRSGAFRKPSRLHPKSLACFGTHDTPTLVGFSKGHDIHWWRKLGWIDGMETVKASQRREYELERLRSSLKANRKPGGIEVAKKPAELFRSVHGALAASPCAMVSVQFDDIEGRMDAQNLPGTTTEHPNWRHRTATPVDQLPEHPGLKEIGHVMAEKDRGRNAVTDTEKAS